jgi:hypothetical protein
MYVKNSIEIIDRISVVDEFWKSIAGVNLAHTMGLNHSAIVTGSWRFTIVEQFNPITTIFSQSRDINQSVSETMTTLQNVWDICSDVDTDTVPHILYFSGLDFQPIVSGSSAFAPRIGNTVLFNKSELSKIHMQPIRNITISDAALYNTLMENDFSDQLYRVFRKTAMENRIQGGSYVHFCTQMVHNFCAQYLPEIPIRVNRSQFEQKKYMRNLILDTDKFANFVQSINLSLKNEYISVYKLQGNKYGTLEKSSLQNLPQILSMQNQQLVLNKCISYLFLFLGIPRIVPIDDGHYSSEYQRIESLIQSMDCPIVPMIPYQSIHY